MTVLLLVLGLLLFIGLVVVHEWGHFIMARRNGVEVEEFGIFFPPALYKKKTKGGWIFSINALPLGGFVKLKGEHDSDTEPGSFGAASTWAKAKIMVAGVVMNLITALVLFTILALVGIPQLVDNQFSIKSDSHLVDRRVLITYVDPSSPAAKAGLQPQDEITGIRKAGFSPVSISSDQDVREVSKRFAGEKVDVLYVREGEARAGKTTMLSEQTVKDSRNTDDPKGYLGVVPTELRIDRYTWSAPVVAVGLSAQLTGLTIQGLGNALSGLGSLIAGGVTGNDTARQNGQKQATEQVAGPVGIFKILQGSTNIGFMFMLFIIAYISLTLAIMNILPIPALDGGRLWIMLISRSINKPLSPRAEELINGIGFLVLIGLIILITVVDVKRFF